MSPSASSDGRATAVAARSRGCDDRRLPRRRWAARSHVPKQYEFLERWVFIKHEQRTLARSVDGFCGPHVSGCERKLRVPLDLAGEKRDLKTLRRGGSEYESRR